MSGGRLHKECVGRMEFTYPLHIEKTLDEAKAEFPDMDGDKYWNGPRAVETGLYNQAAFDRDLLDWYEKWFGKSEKTVADFCAECGNEDCDMSPRSRTTCVNLKYDQWFENPAIQIQEEAKQ